MVRTFDLGLELEASDLTWGQLRLPDMKPTCAALHVEGRDHELIGTTMAVYVLRRQGHRFSASEWSPDERAAIAAAEAARLRANAAVMPGQEMTVRITDAVSYTHLRAHET